MNPPPTLALLQQCKFLNCGKWCLKFAYLVGNQRTDSCPMCRDDRRMPYDYWLPDPKNRAAAPSGPGFTWPSLEPTTPESMPPSAQRSQKNEPKGLATGSPRSSNIQSIQSAQITPVTPPTYSGPGATGHTTQSRDPIPLPQGTQTDEIRPIFCDKLDRIMSVMNEVKSPEKYKVAETETLEEQLVNDDSSLTHVRQKLRNSKKRVETAEDRLQKRQLYLDEVQTSMKKARLSEEEKHAQLATVQKPAQDARREYEKIASEVKTSKDEEKTLKGDIQRHKKRIDKISKERSYLQEFWDLVMRSDAELSSEG